MVTNTGEDAQADRMLDGDAPFVSVGIGEDKDVRTALVMLGGYVRV